MPYIEALSRERLDPLLYPLQVTIESRGDLTYCFTKLLLSQLPPRDQWTYTLLSSLRATLHDASDEYYRRVMVPFENAKKDVNGDVYPPVPWVEDETIPYES